MTYCYRIKQAELGRISVEDLSKPVCSYCLEKVPGWTVYTFTVEDPKHWYPTTHQPDNWCAANAGFWGFKRGDTCSRCGADLYAVDEQTWGKPDPECIERLLGYGSVARYLVNYEEVPIPESAGQVEV